MFSGGTSVSSSSVAINNLWLTNTIYVVNGDACYGRGHSYGGKLFYDFKTAKPNTTLYFMYKNFYTSVSVPDAHDVSFYNANGTNYVGYLSPKNYKNTPFEVKTDANGYVEIEFCEYMDTPQSHKAVQNLVVSPYYNFGGNFITIDLPDKQF